MEEESSSPLLFSPLGFSLSGCSNGSLSLPPPVAPPPGLANDARAGGDCRWACSDRPPGSPELASCSPARGREERIRTLPRLATQRPGLELPHCGWHS